MLLETICASCGCPLKLLKLQNTKLKSICHDYLVIYHGQNVPAYRCVSLNCGIKQSRGHATCASGVLGRLPIHFKTRPSLCRPRYTAAALPLRSARTQNSISQSVRDREQNLPQSPPTPYNVQRDSNCFDGSARHGKNSLDIAMYFRFS
jgi:hypothetical protein